MFILRDPDPAAAGGAGVVTEPNVTSVSTTIPIPDAKAPVIPPPAAGAVPNFALPDAYKDKPYLKGVDSMDKVYAMLDGAQTLIGKRPAGIPAPDAPADEWDKFYEAMGRPKTAAEYVFEGADKMDPKFAPELQKVFHKYGLNPTQAKGIIADINPVLASLAKEKGIEFEKQNTDFDALAAKTFGVERDKILSSSKSLLDKYAPADMKPELAKLSNENLIIMAGVLNNISKTFIKEGGPPGSTPISSGGTPADISRQASVLMQSPEYNNPFHPQHEAVKKQVTDLYNLLRK